LQYAGSTNEKRQLLVGFHTDFCEYVARLPGCRSDPDDGNVNRRSSRSWSAVALLALCSTAGFNFLQQPVKTGSASHLLW
jgi:hypothetical protein